MTGTLIFFLFLLNILLAFALLLLYMRQNRLMDMEKRQKLLLEESEQVMAALLEEMKEENERLLSRMNEKEAKNDKAPGEIIDILIEEEHFKPIFEEPIEIPENDSVESESMVSASESKEYVKTDEPISLKEQVEHLARQGLTVTEIARKLHKGKTEIELLMKFQ